MKSKIEIIPIFSTPLVQISNFLSHQECNDLLGQVGKLEYHRPFDQYTGTFKITTYATNDHDYLRENQPWLQDRLEKKMVEVSKQMGNDDEVEFAVCSSWVTCTIPGGYSNSHTHANSYFSAVMYLQDVVSPIQFRRMQQPGMQFNISEKNHYNANEVIVTPSRGACLMFPSYLNHSVAQNLTDTLRYSIAANFFPTGQWGIRESTVNTIVKGHS